MGVVVSPELEALIDVEGSPTVTEVEKSWVKHFAQSIAWPNPPNPLFFDEEHGKKARCGSIVAPPTCTTRVGWLGNVIQKVFEILPDPTTTLNGGGEYEFLQPIRPGDRLTGRGRLVDIKETPRPDGGVLIALRFAGRVENQKGEHVLTCGSTLLRIYAADNAAIKK